MTVDSSPNPDPEAVVQRQLEAYNARDIDALLAAYADDAELYEHPHTLLARGSAEIRARQAPRLREPNLHAHLVQRMVMGEMVIDQELITRTFPEGTGRIEMIAIYEVRNGRIARAWFKSGAKTLD
jgi:putative hydrolase of HD superfamily